VSRVDAAVEQRVLDRIDELGDELIELTAALADTYCPPGREDAPAAVARDWLDRHEIAYEIVGESPSRPSIIGRIGGAEPAAFRSIVFNSRSAARTTTCACATPATRSTSRPASTATASSATAPSTTRARWRRG
jgi:hypothetical protein